MGLFVNLLKNRNPGFLLQEPHHITDFIQHFIPMSKLLICLPRRIHQIHQIEWTPSVVPSLLTLWDLQTHGPGMLVFSSTHVMHLQVIINGLEWGQFENIPNMIDCLDVRGDIRTICIMSE